MTTRSGVLGRFHLPGDQSGHTLATVGANQTYIIKQINCSNVNATDGQLILFVEDSTATLFGRITSAICPGQGTLVVPCWTAAGPGDMIRAQALTFGVDLYVWVSGAILPGHI